MPSWELSKDIELLFKWLRIREENGYTFPNDFNYFTITVRKSALLHRLLEGKEPLPIPPPRTYSYPWYSLIENGYGYPYEVWKANDNFMNFPAVGIDQTIWKLIKELGKDDYIVSYFYGLNATEKLSETKWHVYCIGCRVPFNTDGGSSNYLWKIERVDESSYISEEDSILQEKP